MNVEKIPKPGTTATRKRFWDEISDIITASRKRAGHNVSIDEYFGDGTIINITRKAGDQIGSCCIGTGFYYGSCFDGYTRAQCEDDPEVQGVWHAEACDEGVNCVFACCHDCICSDETEAYCEDIGGIFQGLDVFCSDDPPPDCSCPPVCPEGDVSVDLSDFPTACTCFFNSGHYEHWDISGIPTSFTMSYDIGIGAWRADFAGALILYEFSDASCETPIGDPVSIDAIAVFFCDPFGAGTYQFTINTNPGSSAITFFAQGSYTDSSLIASNDRCCPGDTGCMTGGIAFGGSALLSW